MHGRRSRRGTAAFLAIVLAGGFASFASAKGEAVASAKGEAVASAKGGVGLAGRLKAIQNCGPRPEGSAGESAAFDYIESSLRDLGLETESGGFADAPDSYSRSRIVEARIAGDRPDELAVVVPVGTWADSPDQTEGAYGIALALEAASGLSKEGAGRLPISVRFVFLGAEKRGRSADARVDGLGSRTWIAGLQGSSRLAVLYLDLGSAPDHLAINNAGSDALSPFWLYEAVRRSLEDSGLAFDLGADRIQVYRLGLSKRFGPAAPYLEAGIPALALSGEGAAPIETAARATKAPPSSIEGGEPWLCPFIEAFASRESGGFDSSWDRHYFIVQLGQASAKGSAVASAVFREQYYVAFLVLFLALASSLVIAATVARRDAAKILSRRLPVLALGILALFAALFLVFLSCRGMAQAEAAILGSANAWSLSPRLFAAARVLFSLFLFMAILSLLVEHRALSPNPHFYEFTALVYLAFDVLVFSAIDLSASFYFAWALVLVLASLAVRRRWATLACYFVMAIPILVLASALAARPEAEAYSRIISPSAKDQLALAALTLPFFAFTASPLLAFSKPGAKARRRNAIVFAACAVAVELGALIYAYALSPSRSLSHRTDLAAKEVLDQDRGIFGVELTGLGRLGAGTVYRDGVRLDYASDRDSVHVTGRDSVKRVEMSESGTAFLDRVDERIELSFADPPYDLELRLDSQEPMLVYDCSLPYSMSADGKSALIRAGVNPGRSAKLSLTLPSSFSARLSVAASYLDPPVSYRFASGIALSRAELELRATFALNGGGK